MLYKFIFICYYTPKLELKEKPENLRKHRKIYDCGGSIYKYTWHRPSRR